MKIGRSPKEKDHLPRVFFRGSSSKHIQTKTIVIWNGGSYCCCFLWKAQKNLSHPRSIIIMFSHLVVTTTLESSKGTTTYQLGPHTLVNNIPLMVLKSQTTTVWMVAKTLFKKMGYFPYQLVSRISSINRISWPIQLGVGVWTWLQLFFNFHPGFLGFHDPIWQTFLNHPPFFGSQLWGTSKRDIHPPPAAPLNGSASGSGVDFSVTSPNVATGRRNPFRWRCCWNQWWSGGGKVLENQWNIYTWILQHSERAPSTTKNRPGGLKFDTFQGSR